MIELNLLLSLKYREEKSIPFAWLEVALRGEQWVRSGRWGCTCMACGTAKTQHPRVQKLLSSWDRTLFLPRRVTAGLGASISLWKRLLFLLGSAECVYALGAEQPVPDESVQPTAACVTDVPSLQQVQALLGRGWGVVVEVALVWKLLSRPVPGSLHVLFSLRHLCFLLLLFLHAHEHRKNNFLCNLATGILSQINFNISRKS